MTAVGDRGDIGDVGDFVDVVEQDELWDGEMEAYDVGDHEVLLVRVDGEIHAYDGICPHQSVSLVEGELEGGVLTCRAHEWSFHAATGEGVNPTGTCLIRHDLRITEEGMVQVRPRIPASSAERH